MDEPTSSNPQLLAWVKEWLDVARERNSKGATAYKNAYESLKACPLVFEHPAELQQLKGFGPKLCERLAEKLRKQCEEDGTIMPEHPQARKAAEKSREAAEGEGGPTTTSKAKKTRKPKSYVPAFRSGAYAIILGLSTLEESSTAGMTKADLIEAAQPYCDSSFTAPSDPTKFYTAWNSIKTLQQKELVYERGRPLRRYALTDEGWEVVQRIKSTSQWQGENGNAEPELPRGSEPTTGSNSGRGNESSASVRVGNTTEDSLFEPTATNDPAVSGVAALPEFTPIVLPRGSFSVQMLLDVREVRAKTDRDYMKEELAKQGHTPIMRSLEVGDIQWVAKCHDPDFLSSQGAEGDEIVLDWIVERKRLDDLIGSIKDGRFHEQKFRLKRCGVKKVVYIIEEISMDSASYQRYEESVQSAIASTQVVNGYFVKRTSKMDETIKYLARMTAMLKRTYENRDLRIVPSKVLTAQNYLPLLEHLRVKEPSEGYYITYLAFASMASKSEMMTLRDVFLKMLMTTKGLTGDRALEISKKWKTPCDLVKAYEACGRGELGKKRKLELMSSQMSHLVGRKKFGKALSQKIAEVWGDA